MMKNYCALAVLAAACGTCTAQSSVTLYGLVDVGVTKTNHGNSISGGFGTPGQWNEQAANQSRMGFKGQEDLGGGSYARFDLQMRFASDTGAAANPFFQARSVVAVGNSKYGEVYMGREYAPELWVAIAVDPTAYSYVSQLGNFTTAFYNSGLPTETYFRHDNNVGFKTASFNGLSAEGAVSLGEGQRKRVQGFNIQYKAAPYYLGVAYDGSDGDNRMWVATGSYDFGFLKAAASYANAKGGLSSLYPGGAKDIALSASIPIGTNRLFFQGAHLTPNNIANRNTTKLGAGFEYYLSKRTWLYTTLGTTKTQGNLSATVAYARKSAFDTGLVVTF